MNELHVVDQGEGDPPLVMVHGYTGSTIDWMDVQPSLAERRRVIAYDHRGHGDSPNTGNPDDYTIDALADDLAALVDHLGLGRFDLLGHSMGGIVVQRYVLAHPERARSLVLMDTMPEPNMPGGSGWLDAAVTVAREQGMGAVSDMFIAATDQMSPGALTDELKRRLRHKQAQADVEAFAALGAEMAAFPSMLARLDEITCPTTVLVGADDAPFLEPSRRMHEAINGSALVLIPDAGHMPQDDQPAAWLAAVEAHLARAAAST